MYLSRLVSGIAMTATLLWIGAWCSGSEPQETADTESAAEQLDSTTAKLAVEEEPMRSEEERPEDAESDREQPDGEDEEVVQIPLSSILTSSPQPGMVHVRGAFPQTSGDPKNVVTNGYLRQILHVAKGGASNAFLVDATNANDAVNASFRVLIGSGGAEIPVPINRPDARFGNYWLVVYLGSGPSNPVRWTVESVIVDKTKVVLSYRRPKPQPATADIRRYYYWVPLGELDIGVYEIQLFDADERVVKLMRRVEITPTTERGAK